MDLLMRGTSRTFEPELVSAIIPVYNAAPVIRRTLDSVFRQTYSPIEIVLVDDCSTDGSRGIIERCISEHPEIIYFRQLRNEGAGAARNKALELARGQYVAFLDADDVWHPEKTEKQVSLLRNKKGAFSYTAIRMVDAAGAVVKSKREVRESIDYRFLLKNTMIATSTVLIDRTILGDFRMPLRRGGQDYATWLMLLRNGVVAYGINEALEDYRIGDKNSLANNKWKSIRQVWEIQTQDEKLGKIRAAANLCCFICNGAKKYLL